MRIPLVCGAVMFALLGVGEMIMLRGHSYAALGMWTLAIVPMALSFYRMRQRARLIYGSFEFCIALGFFYFLLIGLHESEKMITPELILNRMLTLFAAIYFVIRALENIGAGIKGTRFEQQWMSFSHN